MWTFLSTTFLALPHPALAQRVDDNATLLADDAFGAAIGNERIGLYRGSDVRGFSAVTAGNVRLEGLYIDRPAEFSERLIGNETIRVGINAQNYLFNAPTGIDDFRLRQAGNTPLVSAVVSQGDTGASRIELDGQLPLTSSLDIAGGAGFSRSVYNSGATGKFGTYALRIRWKVAPGIEVSPFWGRADTYDRQASPTFVTTMSYLPRLLRRGSYIGPNWTGQRLIATNYGLISKARIGPDWQADFGLFRSINDLPKNYSLLVRNLTPDNQAERRVLSDPPQEVDAVSGEFRIQRAIREGDRGHLLTFSLRGRDRRTLYGGTASITYPRGDANTTIDPAEPDFQYGERTREYVRQLTPGLAYEMRWKGVGSLGLGLQRAFYRKDVTVPLTGATGTRDDSWLYNASLAIDLSHRLALYASASNGLEESGLAPESAANRREVMPAIMTQQIDAGLRLLLPAHLQLVAGLFDVRKSYFAVNEANIYRDAGRIRHRGIEVSLTGAPWSGLNVVAGAVLMAPRASGLLVDQGRITVKPLGVTGRLLSLNINYSPKLVPQLALGLNIVNHGARAADTQGLLLIPPATLIDANIRYKLKIADLPTMLRFQINNLTDRIDYAVLGNASLGFNSQRFFAVYLTVDI